MTAAWTAVSKPAAKVRIAAVKTAAVPVMRLADDTTWQPSRLFSISGIGGVDEQEKRATSALLWAMSAVRPLGRALTARATAPAGVVETFLEVGFPLGEHRVIPDGVIRIARGSRVWTALVEVKTGDAVLHREQLENYLRLAKRRKFDVVLTISNEVSTDPGLHPVQVPAGLLTSVALVHLSWSEVMHEIRMLLAHHPFTDPLPMWILAELLKYLEHPRSGTMAFHDMGVTWVPVREAIAAGTLRSADRKTEPVILAWHRLVRQLGLGLTARLGVPVKQSLPRRLLTDPDLRNHEAAQRLADTGQPHGDLQSAGRRRADHRVRRPAHHADPHQHRRARPAGRNTAPAGVLADPAAEGRTRQPAGRGQVRPSTGNHLRTAG